MRILLALIITLGALLLPTAYAQKAPFVRDASKPYAYLQFDHVGKRKPIRSEESTEGLWLKFVNNSNVPIEVGSFDPGTSDAGIGLVDEVVPYSNPGVRSQSVKPPEGYSGEVYSSMTVQPGDAVLFCVPREQVSKQWYLRVQLHTGCR
jgi:hypothetical protein